MLITKDTWIISDTHFGHYNMVKLCDRPLSFNEKIIEKWEKLVKPQDTVLHLGDLAIFFGPTTKMWQNRASELPGNKYLIRGNHDGKREYQNFTIIEPFPYTQIGQTVILFSHEPQEKENWWDINIHGHMHGNTHHDYPYSLDWHIDAGVDVFGFKPVRLGEILERT